MVDTLTTDAVKVPPTSIFIAETRAAKGRINWLSKRKVSRIPIPKTHTITISITLDNDWSLEKGKPAYGNKADEISTPEGAKGDTLSLVENAREQS